MLLFTGRGVALCLGAVASTLALHKQTVENMLGDYVISSNILAAKLLQELLLAEA